MKSELDYSILQKTSMRLHPARQKTFLPISARICVTILSFRFYGESPFPSAIWISLNLMKAILTIFKTVRSSWLICFSGYNVPLRKPYRFPALRKLLCRFCEQGETMFEIEENTLDELPYSITCLQFACLAYEVAPENVNSMRHLECSMDDSYEAAESALACYCDLISPHDYSDNSECFIYGCYYSSKHMMEFYRLCRTHAKLLRVKLPKEPFFAQAQRFVDSQLGNAYTFDYTLQTKVNREYASGIAARFTEDFYEFENFNMAMINVMRFYRDEAARLKNVLAMTRRTDSDVTIREEAA